MSRRRHLRGHTGTPTIPDRTDPRSRYDLMTDEAFERTPLVRSLDYPCPTCKQPAHEACLTNTGNFFGNGDRSHKAREQLLWSQPCPDCDAGFGEHCTGREPGVNHQSRDEATARAVPGSKHIPPAPKLTPEQAAERRRRALAAFARDRSSTHR